MAQGASPQDSHEGVVALVESKPLNAFSNSTPPAPAASTANSLSKLPTSLFAPGNSAFRVKVSLLGIPKVLKTEATVHRTDNEIDVTYDESTYQMTPSSTAPDTRIKAVETDKNGKKKTYVATPGTDKDGNFTVTTVNDRGESGATFTFKLKNGNVSISLGGLPGSITLIPAQP